MGEEMSRTAILRGREARRDDSGFTLIELLIVIVILGVLAAIVAFSVRGITDRGEVAACKAEVKTVAAAIEAFYAKDDTPPYSYPASIQALADANLLRSADTKYVDSINATTGKMTLTGAPTGCTAA
jgi:prepilin-type N-terminal cleavage/methylation domain-containing protein